MDGRSHSAAVGVITRERLRERHVEITRLGSNNFLPGIAVATALNRRVMPPPRPSASVLSPCRPSLRCPQLSSLSRFGPPKTAFFSNPLPGRKRGPMLNLSSLSGKTYLAVFIDERGDEIKQNSVALCSRLTQKSECGSKITAATNVYLQEWQGGRKKRAARKGNSSECVCARTTSSGR